MNARKLNIGKASSRQRSVAAAGFDPALFEALPAAACYVDADGRVAGFNGLWQSLMSAVAPLRDFSRREVRFVSVCKLAVAEGVRGLGACVLLTLRAAARGDGGQTRSLSCEFAAGGQRFSARMTALCGATRGCLVVCEDVTSQRRIERDLRRLQATEQAQRRIATQYALLARFGQFVLENPPYEQLTQRLVDTVREGLGARGCQLLMSSGDGTALTHAAGYGWDGALAMRSGSRCIEVQITGREGVCGTLSAWIDDEDDPGTDHGAFMQNLANIASACMERRAAEDRLAYMAQFDALTGLPNRTLYLDRLAHAIDAAGRDGSPVAVFFVDVDRFKAVNDTLGHAVGDELLVQIAARLKSSVRASDTIGRLSGDEFALVLSQLNQPDHAAMIGQKITTALSTPFTILGHTVYVSGSVGISLYPADGSEPEQLLKNADMAMYRAKQSGRNGYHFYMPQLQERALRRLTLENRLREALEREQYVLEYQPKVDLKSGRISGLEALLRWRNPEGELVPPREFIPVLEDTGLIIPVGECVVQMACGQIRKWQAAGFLPPPVAVNISARQFRQEGLDVALTRPIRDSGVDPRLIEFELTESMLMRDAEGAIEMLQRIKAQGIKLVLDDFGTGYSSLHYLKLFPLDALKIDGEFVRDMLADSNSARIVAGIVALARNLGLRAVAEGVETGQQLAWLRRYGCNEAQGFGLSVPVPPAQITRMLSERRRWSFLGAPPPPR